MKITRYTDVELRTEGEERKVSGIPIVFNQISDMGWFTEEIDPHALDDADLSDVILNFNHDDNMILARTTNNSLSLEIGSNGVFQTATLIDTTQGNDVYKMLRSGLINKMSFAFTIDKDGEEWKQEADGREHRIIKKIKRLYDVSFVVFPAYEQTSAFAYSKTDELAEKHKALMEKRAEQEKKWKELFNGENS